MYEIYFLISGFSLILAFLLKIKPKKSKAVNNKASFFSRIRVWRRKKTKNSSFKRRALMANFRNKIGLFFAKFKREERFYEIGGGGISEKFKYQYNRNKGGRKTKFDHLFEHKTEIDEEKKKEFLKKIEEYKRMEQEEKKKNKIIKPWGFGSVLPDRYNNKEESSINNAVWNNTSNEEKRESVGFFGRFGGGNEDNTGRNNNVNLNNQGFGNNVNNNAVFGNNEINKERGRNNVFPGFGNANKVEDEKINIFGSSQNKTENKEGFGSLVGKDNSEEEKDDKPIDFFKMFSK